MSSHSAEQQYVSGAHAGIVSRATALIIDLLIISACYAIAIGIAQLVSDFFLINISRLILENSFLSVSVLVVSMMFQILYFAIFWAINGQTPGKSLLGLRVTHIDGRRVGFRRAVLRFFGYWISAVPLLAGFWWVLIDPKRQGWHDKISRTVVIYAWEAQLHHKFVERMHRRVEAEFRADNRSK